MPNYELIEQVEEDIAYNNEDFLTGAISTWEYTNINRRLTSFLARLLTTNNKEMK